MSVTGAEQPLVAVTSAQLESLYRMPASGGSSYEIGAFQDEVTLARISNFTNNQTRLMDEVASYVKFPVRLRANHLTKVMIASSQEFGVTAEHFLSQQRFEPEERVMSVIGLIGYADAYQQQRIKEITPAAETVHHRLDTDNYMKQMLDNMALGNSIEKVSAGAKTTYNKFLSWNLNELTTAVDETFVGKVAVKADTLMSELSRKRTLTGLGFAAVYGGGLMIMKARTQGRAETE
ncbi:MAG TPA: hypothetical protein VFN51_01195 [Candidatus Saccharimonadales bacterium]|nr:hypothetical protein [Candidatus Saccharimonadales bacterium]